MKMIKAKLAKTISITGTITKTLVMSTLMISLYSTNALAYVNKELSQIISECEYYRDTYVGSDNNAVNNKYPLIDFVFKVKTPKDIINTFSSEQYRDIYFTKFSRLYVRKSDNSLYLDGKKINIEKAKNVHEDFYNFINALFSNTEVQKIIDGVAKMDNKDMGLIFNRKTDIQELLHLIRKKPIQDIISLTGDTSVEDIIKDDEEDYTEESTIKGLECKTNFKLDDYPNDTEFTINIVNYKDDEELSNQLFDVCGCMLNYDKSQKEHKLQNITLPVLSKLNGTSKIQVTLYDTKNGTVLQRDVYDMKCPGIIDVVKTKFLEKYNSIKSIDKAKFRDMYVTTIVIFMLFMALCMSVVVIGNNLKFWIREIKEIHEEEESKE